MKNASLKTILAMCCAILVGFAIGFGVKGMQQKHELASKSQEVQVHRLTDTQPLLGSNEPLAPDLFRVYLDPIWTPAIFPVSDASPLRALINFPDNIPKVETKIGDKDVTVQVKVPGLTMKDVNVQVGKDVVAIKGHKEEKQEKGKQAKTISESFEQVVQLPCSVDGDKTKATIKDGVLTILMPKISSNVAQHGSSNWH